MMITGAARTIEPEETTTPPVPKPPAAALAYLGGVVAASMAAVLFAVAARVVLAARAPIAVDAFRQVALLRDAIFTFGVTMPAIAALGHLLLPPARAEGHAARIERLAAGFWVLTALALVAAAVTSGWTTLLLVAAAATLACLALATQSLAWLPRLRAPRPHGTPPSLFARSLAVTSVAAVVWLPVSAGAVAVLVAERLAHVALWRGAVADPLLFEEWLRVCIAPLAYLALLPAIGAVADQLAASARRPFARTAVSIALVSMPLFAAAISVTSLFSTGDAAAVAIGSFFRLVLLVPATVIAGNFVAALRDTLDDASAPSWLALAFVACFVELALTGVPLAMANHAATLRASAFALAHDELLWATLGFAVAAVVHRTWSTLFGSGYRDELARAGAVVAFAGVQLAVTPQLAGGLRGMPLTFEYPGEFRALAIVAGVGWIVAAAGATLIGFNLLAALKSHHERR